MKKITKIFITLAMILSFVTIDVSATTMTSTALDFTADTTVDASENKGYTWDGTTLTLMDDLSVSTETPHALYFRNDATIDLNGYNLSVSTTDDSLSSSTAILFSESLTISGEGNVNITSSYAHGILSLNAASNDVCTIDIDGDVTINAYDSGIYVNNLNVKCDSFTINSNSKGIYMCPTDENDILFDVLGDTKINARIPIYLNDSECLDASTTITNNGGTIYLTSTEDDGYAIYSITFTSTYSLTLQGSGDIIATGLICTSSLSIKDSILLDVFDGVDVDDSLFLGSNATLNTSGCNAILFDIYGTLKVGIIIGNNLSIHDGASVIVDRTLLDDSSYFSDFPYKFAIFLTGSETMMPSITLDENIILYKPVSPAQVNTSLRDTAVVPDSKPMQYFITTVTSDGQDASDDASNVATYIEFGPAYTIDITIEGKGSVNPDTSTIVKGDDITYTFTADEGHELTDVLVDGESLGVITSYTFEEVTQSHTLKVIFTEVVDDTDDADDAGTEGDVSTDTEGDVSTDTEGDVNTDSDVVTDTDDVVDTGDTNDIVLFITLSIVALAVIFMDIKKRGNIS